VGKIDELSCVATELRPDLIFITESWCNSNVTNAYLKPPGCDLQPELKQNRNDMTNGIGGGLLLYLKYG
jgi:hypothetical protein